MKINILTRTSGRPKYFSRCVESIKSQSYENITHIVCADDDDSFEYATKLADKVIRVEKPVKRSEYGIWHSPYNLYVNELLKQVEEGWVLFLDDDDYLSDTDSIKRIVDCCPDEDDLLIFRTQFPYKKIPSDESFGKEIKLGDIANNSFLFHSKHIWAAQWDEVKESDFRCVLKLSRILKRILWLNATVTCVGNSDHDGRGGFGTRRDI